MILYFGYGSNLDASQMRHRCPDSRVVQVGWLQDYRLEFTRYSTAWEGGVGDVVRHPGEQVWGQIYLLSQADLDSLDEYEGYPRIYTRFTSPIETHDGRVEGVWVYEVVDKQGFVSPATGYLKVIQDAAEELGFPDGYRSYLAAFRTPPR